MKTAFKSHSEWLAEREALIERIRAMLAGQDSLLVGLALGELLACWLAGHICLEELDCAERPETTKLREEILHNHIDLVRDMIKPYDDAVRRKLKASAH